MPSLPKLKVAFSDFWKDFDPLHNIIADSLSCEFAWQLVSLPEEQPDLVFVSLFGSRWREFSCPRILVAGENISSDLRHFDAGLTFDPPSETNYYLPLYRYRSEYNEIFQPRTLSRSDWLQKKSIAAVFSNPKARFRNEVYFRFREKFQADSGGKAFNTVGGPVQSKNKFLEDYKFSLAFENTAWSGYTTEKILEAYAYKTVPIYWGDPTISKTFNSKSFIWITGSGNLPVVEETLERLLNDFDAYREVYEQPLFIGNQEPEFLKPKPIGQFILRVLTRGVIRTQKKVTDYHLHLWGSRWRVKQISEKHKILRNILVYIVSLDYPLEKLKTLLRPLLRRRSN